MLMRTCPALLWTLLVVPMGCQSSDSSLDEYLKIDDMESPTAGEDNGYKASWSCTISNGTQRNNILPPMGALTFTKLNPNQVTMPGVVSEYAARLWSTQPLDTTPDKAQSNGEGQEERLWGANIAVELVPVPDCVGTPDGSPSGDNSTGTVPSAQGCPLKFTHSTTDAGVSSTTVDLSGYSGLVFWAKGEGSAYAWPPDAGPSDAGGRNQTMERRIRVMVHDQFSDFRGGKCSKSRDIKDTQQKCYNAFSTTFVLTDSFARYEVDFSKMWRDPTWGLPPDKYQLDVQHVYSIAFEVGAAKCVADQNATCAHEFPPLAFDFWIDDLYLVKHNK